MTTPGHYGGQPRQPVNVTQVRICGPQHVVDQVRQVLETAADTMPGWRIVNISRPLAAQWPSHTRRYVDLEVDDPSPSGRYRYPTREEEHDA